MSVFANRSQTQFTNVPHFFRKYNAQVAENPEKFGKEDARSQDERKEDGEEA